MKTQEELNEIKEEVETLNKKLHELTEEELAQVTGGISVEDLVRKKSSYMFVDRTNNGYAHVQGKYDAPDE